MYICIDGIDGVGKDTQTDFLVQNLQVKGFDPLRLNEPDASLPTGALLRQWLKSGEHQEAHAALFLADRIVMMTQKVNPALAAGRPVVCARSFLSTLVYQQENWPLDWLMAIHAHLPAKPDRLFVMDMDPEKALARTSGRAFQEVYEKLDIQRRNRQRYLDLATDPRLQQFLTPSGRVVVVDASGTPEQVQDRVCQHV